MKKYGKTEEEITYEKMQQCREIVQEILSFGVNEFQKFKIIELLCLELESRAALEEITSATKKYLDLDEDKSAKLITAT